MHILQYENKGSDRKYYDIILHGHGGLYGLTKDELMLMFKTIESRLLDDGVDFCKWFKEHNAKAEVEKFYSEDVPYDR